MKRPQWMAALVAGALAGGAARSEAATFAEDVAPVIFSSCSSCHRPGEAAPFPLTNYAEVRRKGRLIRDVVEEGLMPPWHSTDARGAFAHDRRLTDEQVATIGAWVDAGMPEGDTAKLPAFPKFPDGWQLGEPDLVVEMDEAFTVPAEGRDIYRYFVLPLRLESDRWVKALEVRPSARPVVHHVLFFLDNKGKARELAAADPKPGFRGKGFRRTGDLGGWAVGSTPQPFPEGLSLPLPKGSDLVLQTHFHPSGKEEAEKTKVGIYFADAPPEKKLFSFQVPPAYGRMAGINIPPGQKDFVIEDSFVLPAALDLVNVWGHAHQVCTSIRGTVTLPDGKVEPLLTIPEWDFNWQTTYQYREMRRLPAGSEISVRITYDNSADNPNNPSSPPKRVRWGEQSNDEMGSLIFQAVAAEESTLPTLVKAERKQRRDAELEATVRWVGAAKFRGALAVIRGADRDGDGKVARKELEAEWKALAFRALDHDGDGAIGEAEFANGEAALKSVFGKKG